MDCERCKLDPCECLVGGHLPKRRAEVVDVGALRSDRDRLRALVVELTKAFEAKLSDWERDCHAPMDLIARAKAAVEGGEG